MMKIAAQSTHNINRKNHAVYIMYNMTCEEILKKINNRNLNYIHKTSTWYLSAAVYGLKALASGASYQVF